MRGFTHRNHLPLMPLHQWLSQRKTKVCQRHCTLLHTVQFHWNSSEAIQFFMEYSLILFLLLGSRTPQQAEHHKHIIAYHCSIKLLFASLHIQQTCSNTSMWSWVSDNLTNHKPNIHSPLSTVLVLTSDYSYLLVFTSYHSDLTISLES